MNITIIIKFPDLFVVCNYLALKYPNSFVRASKSSIFILCLECVSESSLIRWIDTVLPWLGEIVGLYPNTILLPDLLFNHLAISIDWLVYVYTSVIKNVTIAEDKRKFLFKNLKLIEKIDTTINN